MGDTSIEWTDKVWNPTRGCSRVSEGCRHCYAEGIAARFSRHIDEIAGPYFGQTHDPFHGFATMTPQGPRWTGKVALVPEKLMEPLRWKKPRRVFVNSMSDLFHEDLPEQAIIDVFGVMALAHGHTFQILTKRPERMRAFLAAGDHGILDQFRALRDRGGIADRLVFQALDIKRRDGVELQWPLQNVWLGVSVENQEAADARIPLLLRTPAAVRFLSVEPLLGPVQLDPTWIVDYEIGQPEKRIDWVIGGFESGRQARPGHRQWARALRDQCVAAGVPFFWKQNGAWYPVTRDEPTCMRHADDPHWHNWWTTAENGERDVSLLVGKKKAGRELDGRTWNEFPNVGGAS